MRYFACVADKLSFSRAAETLNVSQSALSRQIQLLESELGVKLFDRIGRRIALTPAGRELLQRCRAILHDVESFQAKASQLAGGLGGVLRVGATPQTLESLISRFLPRYRRKNPNVEVVLTEDGSARLSQHVENGHLNLAVGALTSTSSLSGRMLFPLAALAVVPTGHRLKGKATIEISDLADEPLLLLAPQFMTRQLFDGACQVSNLEPRVLIESASPHCLLSLVAVQQGIAIIPSTVLLEELRPNAIPLKHDGKTLGFWMSAIWDPRRHMSAQAEGFIEELFAATRENYPGKSFDLTDVAQRA